MDDRLQGFAPLGVSEDQGTQPRAVQGPVGGQYVGAELLDDLGQAVVPGATTSRASTSASTTTAPSSASIAADRALAGRHSPGQPDTSHAESAPTLHNRHPGVADPPG